ncbi:MAG: L,D-transpeptidase [Planctomycetota bacterium]|nr:L,D-transpeptidase [Planctomycetota bacterium]
MKRHPRNPLHQAEGGFRVVIEKSARRLTVYDGGKVVKTYRASFGTGNGDKVREGDCRTPEGEFYVCYKNNRSRFTLSLGLSYPNIEDAKRGMRDGLITHTQHDAIVEAIRHRRRPPWNTPLGGEIMIHGCGSDRDWTIGCIALDDDDIKELFAALPLGSPVEIRN